MWVNIFEYKHVCARANIYIHAYAFMCRYVYIYTHTNTQALKCNSKRTSNILSDKIFDTAILFYNEILAADSFNDMFLYVINPNPANIKRCYKAIWFTQVYLLILKLKLVEYTLIRYTSLFH